MSVIFSLLLSPSGRKRRRHRGLRMVEFLERRSLLSTFQWVSATGGDWNLAANWENQNGQPGVPGANDDAVIDVSGITVTVSQSISVNSLTLASSSTLDVTTGIFSVANSGTRPRRNIGSLDLAAGTTFHASGGTAQLDGGAIAGQLNVASGATLENAGSTTIAGQPAPIDWRLARSTISQAGTLTCDSAAAP